MKKHKLTRREFLKSSVGLAAGATIGSFTLGGAACTEDMSTADIPVVSITKIKNKNIGYAVEEAIDLLGGMKTITKGKDRIMLKPNLVSPDPSATTNPEVIRTLGQLMKKAGKDVLIGEGSAAAQGFNVKGAEIFRTKKREILDPMQQSVFDTLGYSDLASTLKVPLLNLHTGEMTEVSLPDGFVFDKLTIHKKLTDIDLLCSVPMMKTHTLAHVTLGMKNLIGLYPGTIYQSVRGHMHDMASKVEPSGTASAIVDMVRANKLGLVVVDASMAMEGEGPSDGQLVEMDLIIAGTNPLATDMIASAVMGFKSEEIPTFSWAQKAGMKPLSIEEIEIRGERVENVRRNFLRPTIYTWESIRNVWGAREI
jgi:uncharacterized protein (DUF362 family)